MASAKNLPMGHSLAPSVLEEKEYTNIFLGIGIPLHMVLPSWRLYLYMGRRMSGNEAVRRGGELGF